MCHTISLCSFSDIYLPIFICSFFVVCVCVVPDLDELNFGMCLSEGANGADGFAEGVYGADGSDSVAMPPCDPPPLVLYD